ncbi:MAG TPA: hypothetical protein VEZ89_04600 [Rubrivivax sp.]|nr:hypothetical protein [Rubrivivax sp.]
MRTKLTAAIAFSLLLNVILVYRTWFAPSATQVANSTGRTVVMRTPGGLLEVSRITAEERFDSTTSHTVLGVPVGKTVAQVRVPAVYRYHIPLAHEWTIRHSGPTLIVVAPPVQPTLPVAIDTSRLESFASGLWSPVTGPDAVGSLQKSITAKLGERAASQQLVLMQREAARQTLGEFIQKWVVEQSPWKGSKPPTVLVFFEDEPLGKKAAPLLLESP